MGDPLQLLFENDLKVAADDEQVIDCDCPLQRLLHSRLTTLIPSTPLQEGFEDPTLKMYFGPAILEKSGDDAVQVYLVPFMHLLSWCVIFKLHTEQSESEHINTCACSPLQDIDLH